MHAIYHLCVYFCFSIQGKRLKESTLTEEPSEKVWYSSSLDVGCLEAGCIDGIGVVVIVVIVNNVFAGDVFVIRLISMP